MRTDNNKGMGSGWAFLELVISVAIISVLSSQLASSVAKYVGQARQISTMTEEYYDELMAELEQIEQTIE